MAEDTQDRRALLLAELEKRKKAKEKPKVVTDASETEVQQPNDSGLGPVGRAFAPGSVKPTPKESEEMAGAILGTAADVTIAAGLPTIGQFVGMATGPLAPIAVPVLGALGGATGEIINEIRHGGAISPGKILRSAAISSMPGGQLEMAGGKELLKQGSRFLGMTAAGTAAEKQLDEGRLPTLPEVGKDILEAAAQTVGAKLGAVKKPMSKYEQVFADRDAAITAAKKEGINVKVPPSMLSGNKSSLTTAADASSLAQKANEHNLYEFQKNARQEIGLPTTGRLTIRPDEDLKAVREAAAEPYEKIQKIASNAEAKLKDFVKEAGSDTQEVARLMATEEGKNLQLKASVDIERLKELRANSQKAWDKFKQGKNPEAYQEWKTAHDSAESMENRIDEIGRLVGDEKLLQDLRESRKKIAQSYSIENALADKTTGLLDPALLASQLNAGVPLTGKLKAIADFTNAFDKAAVQAAMFMSPTGATIIHQMPTGSLANSAMKMISMAGRPFLMSDFIQSGLGKNYDKANVLSVYSRLMAEHAAHQKLNPKPEESQ